MGYNCGDQDPRARADLLVGPLSFVPFIADASGWGNPFEPKLQGEWKPHAENIDFALQTPPHPICSHLVRGGISLSTQQ